MLSRPAEVIEFCPFVGGGTPPPPPKGGHFWALFWAWKTHFEELKTESGHMLGPCTAMFVIKFGPLTQRAAPVISVLENALLARDLENLAPGTRSTQVPGCRKLVGFRWPYKSAQITLGWIPNNEQ